MFHCNTTQKCSIDYNVLLSHNTKISLFSLTDISSNKAIYITQSVKTLILVYSMYLWLKELVTN